MCMKIRKNVPDYKYNPYICGLEKWEQEAFELIESEQKLDDENLMKKIQCIMEHI